jgi:hypothetical protein
MADERGFLVGQSLREKLKSTIAKVDSIAPGGPVSRIPTVIESPIVARNPQVFRVATISSAWSLNSLGTVKLKNVASTPNTVSVLNQLVSLPAPRSTNATRVVNIAKDGTQWYLVSFQMATATAVFAGSTQSISFVSTAGTSAISFLSSASTASTPIVSGLSPQDITYSQPGPEVNVVVGVSAKINTNNCSVIVDTVTTKIKTAGPTQKTTVVTSWTTATVTTVRMGGTQTAAIFSSGSTQRATVMGSTYTATYISLEI